MNNVGSLRLLSTLKRFPSYHINMNKWGVRVLRAALRGSYVTASTCRHAERHGARARLELRVVARAVLGLREYIVLGGFQAPFLLP